MSQFAPPEQSIQPVPSPKKRNWFSRIPPRVRVALALAIIALAVVLAFHGSGEGEADNVTGDPEMVPTVAITNLVGTLPINKSVDVNEIHLTVIKVMEASKFSDDRKRAGTYTVRVLVQAKNNGSSPVGIQYNELARLVLTNGQVIAPKFTSVLPDMLPGSSEQGFIDFPVSTQVPLSSLALRFGNEAVVAFSP